MLYLKSLLLFPNAVTLRRNKSTLFSIIVTIGLSLIRFLYYHTTVGLLLNIYIMQNSVGRFYRVNNIFWISTTL